MKTEDRLPVPKEASTPDATAAGVYVLRPNDVIEISVLDEPDMTKEVTVIPDGTITYPLVGSIQAQGKTLKQLRDEITKALDEYYVSPRVSILTKKVHTSLKDDVFATIIGPTLRPGKYPVEEGDRIIDFVAKSGGLSYGAGGRITADLEASYLSREGAKLDVDFDKLIRFGDMGQNILLKGGDLVYLADPQEAASVVMVGALAKPGKFPLQEGMRVVDAVAEAGGFLFTQTDQGARTIANLKASYISRGGKRLDVDLERLFQGGDMRQNIELERDDFIFIADSQLDAIYVLGEVNFPRLVPYDQDMNISEVIARANGFTERAQRTRILVVRAGLAKPIEVDLEALLLGDPSQKDVQLRGNDIIFVPEQGLSEYSRYARYLQDFGNLVLTGFKVQEQVTWPRLQRYDSVPGRYGTSGGQ